MESLVLLDGRLFINVSLSQFSVSSLMHSYTLLLMLYILCICIYLALASAYFTLEFIELLAFKQSLLNVFVEVSEFSILSSHAELNQVIEVACFEHILDFSQSSCWAAHRFYF